MKIINNILILGILTLLLGSFIQCQRSFDTVSPGTHSNVSFNFNFQQQQGTNTISSGENTQFIGKVYIEVTAPDMEKINRTVNINGDQVTVKMTIPQGDNRRFVIQARDSKNITWFRTDTTVSLKQTEVRFNVKMHPSFKLILFKVDDGSAEASTWFESPDTLMLSYFFSSYQTNKLLHILLYNYADNQENGNYRLVVTDTLGNLLWKSVPVDYLGEGQWIDWQIVDDVRLPQNFLVGIQYTKHNGYPEIGVDMSASGNSFAYVISTGQFLFATYGNWMIRAVVASPTGTQKMLSPQPFPGVHKAKQLTPKTPR